VHGKDPKNVDGQILMANALAGLRDLDGAVGQIEEALRIAPERSGAYSNLGALELGRGNRVEAERAFKKAVELQSESIPAHVALGNFYWLTDRYDLAEQSLGRALELGPTNPLTNRALASFYLATNRLKDAERPLKAVFEATKTLESALALEEYYEATGEEAAARTMLQSMLSDPRSSATANVRLAALDYKAEHRDQAYQRLATVLQRDPANLPALLTRFSLQLADKQPNDALTTANAAVQGHPESASAFFALAQAQSSLRQQDAAIAAYQEVLRLNPRATEAKIRLGQLQLAQGRSDTSLGLAAEALATEPGNGAAQLLYVRGLLAQGQMGRAEVELKPLVARFPNSPAVHTQLGILYGQQNKIQVARAEFERALTLEPLDLEALGGMVALDVAAKNYAAARARVDARIAAGATAPVYMLAARTYAASGDLAATERLLRQAINADGSYVAGYGALGQLYAVQGKLKQAQAEFEAVVQRSPNSIAARTMVAVIVQGQGDWKGAQERFEQILQMDPEAPVAANNLAWIYAEHGGNLDVAMQLAQTAQKRLPDVAAVSDTLGSIYYRKDLTSLAISTLKISTAKDPTNALYHYHLGMAYANAGDSVHSRESLSRALSLKPDFDGAEQARQLLNSRKPE
jgi:tetratricopeptide (TPR) repeat protein